MDKELQSSSNEAEKEVPGFKDPEDEKKEPA